MWLLKSFYGSNQLSQLRYLFLFFGGVFLVVGFLFGLLFVCFGFF